MPLTAGTNVAATPFPKKITLTLPDGWYGNIGGPYAVFLSRLGPTAEVDFVIFNRSTRIPVTSIGDQNPLPGPGGRRPRGRPDEPAGDDGHDAGRRHGRRVPRQAVHDDGAGQRDGCTLLPGTGFRVWELPLGATNDMQPGDRQQVTVLDVDGTRVVLDVTGLEDGSTKLTPEVQAIVDSIRIEPGN